MSAVRDPEQPMRALQLANDIRLHVAAFKRDIKGRNYIDALRVLIEAIETRHDDPLLGAAKVRQMLMAVSWIGPRKSTTYMLAVDIDRSSRLRDLTTDQRTQLVRVLEQMAWRRRS